MIILASSSPTRAQILRDFDISFRQISFCFDESKIPNDCAPHVYVQRVVKEKKEQFLSANANLKNFLIADSCVACAGQILGKAQDEAHAREMLNLQSDNTASVFSAFCFVGENFEILNVSEARYKFAKFNQNKLEEYLKSGLWQGKAGAMTIEGFNKNFIIFQSGNESTAMGLNIEQLKAFL